MITLKEKEESYNLALEIWNIVNSMRCKFSVPQALLSVVDSNLILSYPGNKGLDPITFTCNANTEDVLSTFSDIAGKSPINGKVYCRNTKVHLFFR